MTLRKLAEHAKEGVRAAGGFPMEFGTITVSDGISMGHEGMRASLVSREVITDSVECVDARRAARRLRRPRRLRQEHPGDADGRRPPRPAERVRLQRLDHAGRPQRHGARHHQRVRGRRRVRAGQDHRGRARRDRAQGVPGRGRVRRHVHGQHDELDRRGDRDVAARHRVAAGRRSPPRGRCACAPARPSSNMLRLGITPRHDHDQAGVRERDRGHVGARRLDQRRAAPARDRQRGRRRAASSRTSTASPPRCRTSPT